MLSATPKYDSKPSITECEHFGTRTVPLKRAGEQVGTVPLIRPRFIDYVVSMNGKLVVHGEITEDGILWHDVRD